MCGGDVQAAYFVDDPGDRCVELPLGGTDEVNSYISYTLTDNVENLRLRTAASIDGAGNELNNRLIGNSGATQLDGGAGNDTLVGSGGADILTGGAGADIFSYRAVSDSQGSAVDHIRDFTPGEDRMDLAAIDADSTLDGRQSFSFIGSAAFDGHAGELRFEQDGAGSTAILGDLNGDGVPDFEIRIDATVVVGQAELIL
jgi:Ca2+-binding RTX toxin-like protein